MLFLWIFLPLVLAAYYLSPRKIRNGILVFFSLLFYAWGEPVYILLMLCSVLVNFMGGIFMEDHKTHRKGILWGTVLINLGLLGYFKYFNFLAEIIGKILPGGLGNLSIPQVALPIGISFYTFQALSYVIDVYRGEVKAQRNFWYMLLYISFFPQLIAGPIVKYHDIRDQLEVRDLSADRIAEGLRRFSYGLAKKVLISNTMAVVADYAFGLPGDSLSIYTAWLGAVCYMLQIYFDFSGYSDMAIGLGRMFGFVFKENFRYPYAAVGIKDFWRRWHISLSTWFKEYLYIPLGGNRRGKARMFLNQMIVFAATGLWHGANLTFLVWGLFHGLFLTMESIGVIPIGKAAGHPVTRFIARIYTLFIVLVGFTLFRSDSMTQALSYLGVLFTGGTDTAAQLAGILTHLTPWFICILLIACVTSFPIFPAVQRTLGGSQTGARIYTGAAYAVSFLLLMLCILSLAADTYNPFIYFRF